MDDKRPNCIVLAADQLRYDVLGLGYTPNIDELLKDSICFSNAYCASPLCVPARGALFTGTYPGVNGSLINGWTAGEKPYSRVKQGIDNLYNRMEQMGMECIHSGKQHLFTAGTLLEERPDTKTKWVTTEQTYRAFLKKAGKRAPGGPDFRTWIPEMSDGIHTKINSYSNPRTGRYEEGYDYYFDGYFTNEALKALDEYQGEAPLFLSMMYLAPHPPFDVPEPWYSEVRSEEIELPENVGKWYPNQSPLQKYNLTGYIGTSYTLEEWREAWRAYLGLVSLLDHCVGAIIQKLKEKDLYDNALILFLSDHGEMLGSHRLFQKMCMYEESVKTPLAIHLPGGQGRNSVRNELVSHIDIFPTICDLYGQPIPEGVNGRSLKPLFSGEGTWSARPVYIQYDGNASRGNFQRCVIWNGYKYIIDIFKDERYYELYKIAEDRQETKNLLFAAKDQDRRIYQEIALEMDALLQNHMEGIGDYIPAEKPDFSEFAANYSQ